MTEARPTCRYGRYQPDGGVYHRFFGLLDRSAEPTSRDGSARERRYRQLPDPAHIPQEIAGSSRKHPVIPQASRPKVLLMVGIAAYPGVSRSYHYRPVTPEVAGSSPVAPVKSLQIGIYLLSSCA